MGPNSVVATQIQKLSALKIDLKEIASPFFELESVYYRYCKEFGSLLRILAQDDANFFISKYCDLSCMKLQGTVHLNVDLSFSPECLRQCKHDIEILSGQRTTSIWGHWDVLLKWEEWTKNGISPTNDVFEQNLSHLFRELKISETAQSLGLFFLEQLASAQTVVVHSEICLNALELFLDQDDQYWIIAHCADENGEKHEFFIKRLGKKIANKAGVSVKDREQDEEDNHRSIVLSVIGSFGHENLVESLGKIWRWNEAGLWEQIEDRLIKRKSSLVSY
ncbi:MAG: hypothetical protein LLF94_02765 [Chlamydiales bacterium]|nr:hypothetical protein [Chlamydiales bacterium]